MVFCKVKCTSTPVEGQFAHAEAFLKPWNRLEKVSDKVYSLSYVSIPLSRKGLSGTCIWRDEPH